MIQAHQIESLLVEYNTEDLTSKGTPIAVGLMFLKFTMLNLLNMSKIQ